jgi:hypothetical protein
MVMIPNYEFKMKLPVYDVNLLDTKKLDQKTHDTLIEKILAYPDVMKHNTNVKANMTDWRMHMKDDDFGKVATLAENVAKEMRYGSTHVDGDTHTKRKGQSPRLMTEECWGASYGKGEYLPICSGYVLLHYTYYRGKPNPNFTEIETYISNEEWERIDMIEPHKYRQGSFTMIKRRM